MHSFSFKEVFSKAMPEAHLSIAVVTMSKEATHGFTESHFKILFRKQIIFLTLFVLLYYYFYYYYCFVSIVAFILNRMK